MAATTETHPGDKHEIPEYEAHESSTSLKERIKKHYEIASDYYYSLWYETAAKDDLGLRYVSAATRT